MTELRPILGILVFLGLAFAISSARQKISWRLVLVGIGMQLVFALVILKTTIGPAFFRVMNEFFVQLFNFVGDGARFVFGDLVDKYPFGFHVLPTILFFSAVLKVLYDLGIMHRLVNAVGYGMQKLLKVSGAESISAAANIFMGQTEAPLVVRPYVSRMTRSELMAVMTGGMATVAGSVMAAYIGMLSKDFPQIAGHLMAASIMSAPAAFVFAKIIVPETETPVTTGHTEVVMERDDGGVLHSFSLGAKQGIQLVFNIAAMLIVFIAAISAFNYIWGQLCSTGTEIFGFSTEGFDSLQELLGYAFAPFAWLMGVSSADLLPAGMLIGEKTVVNEFVAYANFRDMLRGDEVAQFGTVVLDERSKVVLAYALCGFSNFSSIGILIGGLGAIAPERMKDVAQLGLRAMVAATFACFMTACIAVMLS